MPYAISRDIRSLLVYDLHSPDPLLSGWCTDKRGTSTDLAWTNPVSRQAITCQHGLGSGVCQVQ
eukprot:2252502-Amphidinium_carterae.1